jgi:hypothetical protein
MVKEMISSISSNSVLFYGNVSEELHKEYWKAVENKKVALSDFNHADEEHVDIAIFRLQIAEKFLENIMKAIQESLKTA